MYWLLDDQEDPNPDAFDSAGEQEEDDEAEQQGEDQEDGFSGEDDEEEDFDEGSEPPAPDSDGSDIVCLD